MSKSKSTKTNHYTYIIRHINGRYYVGRRSTKKDPLLDPYMGSGTWVRSIKDRSTLTKDIIDYCDTFDELKIAEMELIARYFDDVYCMNVAYSSCGFAGGDKNPNYGRTGDKNNFYGRTHTEESKQKISDRMSGELNPNFGKTGELCHNFGKTGELSPNFGSTRSRISKQKMSDSKTGDKNPMYGKIGELNPNFGRTGELSPNHGRKASEEAKQNMSDNHADVSGNKNPNYDKTGELSHNYGLIRSKETKRKMSDAQSGSKHSQATITEVVARLIKIRISEGVKVKIIAEEYNTTVSVVNGIKYGSTWKHITI